MCKYQNSSGITTYLAHLFIRPSVDHNRAVISVAGGTENNCEVSFWPGGFEEAL